MASTSRGAGRRSNATHSQSRVTQSQPETEEVELDHQVRAIINFILRHSANKVPIKNTDLLPLANGKQELARRFPLVTALLAERYGLNLVQLEGAPKRYICVAESPAMSIYELTPAQRPQHTMLYIILTYIFLRSNRIEKDKLYTMLDLMGVNVEEDHGYFVGDISTLIDSTFVKQQYLKEERSQLSPYDDFKTYYSWGARAKAEIPYQQITEFAAKLFDQDVSFFQQQLMMAEEMANPDIVAQLTDANNQMESRYFDLDDESQTEGMDMDSQ